MKTLDTCTMASCHAK